MMGLCLGRDAIAYDEEHGIPGSLDLVINKLDNNSGKNRGVQYIIFLLNILSEMEVYYE